MDDKTDRIHKEGGGEKKEAGSKGDGDNVGEGEEREGAASLKDVSNEDKIYGTIASGQGTTTKNAKDDAKDNDAEEGRMVRITQFWVCAMGHMKAAVELIMDRDIYCIEHVTNVTC